MNVAIITGASSGLGIEYIKHICERYGYIQQYWIIARRRERLEEIAKAYPDKNIVPIDLDLLEYDSYKSLDEMLKKANADIKVMVNNAGFGVLGEVYGSDAVKQSQMVDLN